MMLFPASLRVTKSDFELICFNLCHAQIKNQREYAVRNRVADSESQGVGGFWVASESDS